MMGNFTRKFTWLWYFREVKRLDYKIDEEGRYTQLSVGDYEKLVSILNQIETGELRP